MPYGRASFSRTSSFAAVPLRSRPRNRIANWRIVANSVDAAFSRSTLTICLGVIWPRGFTLANASRTRLALAIVVLNDTIGLEQSAWAITACTYVIAGSSTGTIDRVRRRIIGTAIGVPLGIACLSLALHAPLLAWVLTALAMVIYAMALPERYDIAARHMRSH
jgi:hypothetical protein